MGSSVRAVCRALGWLHCRAISCTSKSLWEQQLCCLLHIQHCLSLPQKQKSQSGEMLGYPMPCPVCPSGNCTHLFITAGTGRRAGQGSWLMSPLSAGHHGATVPLQSSPAPPHPHPLHPSPPTVTLLLCTTEIPALAPHPPLPLMLFTFKC